VGKVYFSDKFLNINSTEFRRDEKSSLLQTPFVNMGLLMGLKRSGELDLLTEADEYDMSARLSELVKMAPPYMETILYKMFLSKNKEKLTETQLPYFIPKKLGGLGLPVLLKFKNPADLEDQTIDEENSFMPSQIDLQIAHRIIMLWNKVGQRPRSTPKEGVAAWMRTKERVKEFEFETREEETIQEQKISHFLMMDEFISGRMNKFNDYPDLSKSEQKSSETAERALLKRIRNHNRKLWSIQGTIKKPLPPFLPTPISIIDLLQHKPTRSAVQIFSAYV
jgi:hypothetical protein